MPWEKIHGTNEETNEGTNEGNNEGMNKGTKRYRKEQMNVRKKEQMKNNVFGVN